MKLKIMALLAALSTTFIESNEFSIRFAQKQDIPACTALHKKVSTEFFKPAITAGYPEYFDNNPEVLDEFFNEVDSLFNQALDGATSTAEDKEQHFLIALDTKKPDKIVGLCAFSKEDDSLHFDYMIVSEKLRKKGIGKALFNQACATYKDISSYKLDTLNKGNEAMHQTYESYGFTSTKTPCTLYERTPNTHIMYELKVKKN